MHGQGALPCPTHLLHRLSARHVHDHNRDADDLGMADCAMRRISLDDLGPRGPMKRRPHATVDGPGHAACSWSIARPPAFFRKAASAMHSERVADADPALQLIIKQLSADRR